MSLKKLNITRRFLRLRYGLAMALIAFIALAEAGFNWSLSSKFQSVTNDFVEITILSGHGTDSINKIHQLLSLDASERTNYSSSARLSLNLMDASLKRLQVSASQHESPHLDTLSSSATNGAKILERMIKKGREIVEKAENGSEKQADRYAFSSLATSQYSQLISRLTTDVAAEQKRLSNMSLKSSSFGAFALLFLVFSTVVLIFSPMENSIVNANEALKTATEKALEADKTKSEFLANMSHEIRTPLNGVMGMASLLNQTELSEKQRTFAEIILKSGNSLLSIINDILDFSRIDAGKLELEAEPFDLTETIDDVVALISTKAMEKNIEIFTKIDPNLPSRFVGDAGRMRQILTNLLGNAVKFTDQGHVAVTVESSTENRSDFLPIEITVKDTGIGIPEKYCQRIFEKFSQVDGSSTKQREGTGLGLAITVSLVELMKGTINVCSKLGEGSTFTVNLTLPVHRVQEKFSSSVENLHGKKIMLVDSNARTRALILDYLKNWEIDCAAAKDNAEALQFIKFMHTTKRRVDCVILDSDLSISDREQIARLIKTHKNSKDVAIITLASFGGSDLSDKQSQHYSDGIVQKPINPVKLRTTLVDTICSSSENAVAVANVRNIKSAA